MSARWKRNTVVATMAVLVCAAVALNWRYSGQEALDAAKEAGTKILGEATLVSGRQETERGDAGEAAQTGGEAEAGPADEAGVYAGSDYFASARLTRQQARDNAISLLQEAAGGEKADQNSIDEANAAIQTMAGYTVTEAQIENLITAKGYADCVAFLGEDSISVVVSAVENGMTDTDAARIGEIVMEQTGLKADQIKIIEAE